jgi:DNA-binding response OmpR family regulator
MPGRKKILIIDDETDLCLLLKDYFVRKNYEVEVAHTLKEGVEMLYSSQPDMLFLDNNLPDGTGWNTAPQYAIDFPGIYIVLISAFHPVVPEMPVGARFCIIEKPISLGDLDNQFSKLLLEEEL